MSFILFVLYDSASSALFCGAYYTHHSCVDFPDQGFLQFHSGTVVSTPRHPGGCGECGEEHPVAGEEFRNSQDVASEETELEMMRQKSLQMNFH